MLLPRRALLGITASMMACAWASMLQAGTVHAAPEPEAAQRVASQIEQDFVQVRLVPPCTIHVPGWLLQPHCTTVSSYTLCLVMSFPHKIAAG